MTPQELTEIRTALNLTKTDLAKKLGITAMLVGKYEKGSAPIPETVIKSVEALMEEIPTETAAEEKVATSPDEKPDTPEEEGKAEEGAVDIAAFVKSVRSGLGLSQKAFAELLGVSGASVGFYENGKNAPRDKVLEKIKKLSEMAASITEKVEEETGVLVEKKKAGKKAEKPKAVERPARKETKIFIQSMMGGSITPEDVMKKVPEGVDEIYVKPEENKAYWVKGNESGSIDLW